MNACNTREKVGEREKKDILNFAALFIFCERVYCIVLANFLKALLYYKNEEWQEKKSVHT